jgi:hypothetical protein
MMTAVVLAVSALQVSAQWTTLIVFAPGGEKFTLYYNGDRQNDDPAPRVQVDNISGPSFKVKVVFESNGVPDLGKTIFNRPGTTMYYALVKNQKNAFILQTATEEWSNVTEEQPKPEGKAVSASPTGEKSGVEKKGGTGCDNPMTEPDFIASLVSVSAAPFDGPKLSAAKKVASGNCLTTAQVIHVMSTFDMESSRLSFAKYAYEHTWDQDHYSDVSDALNSDSSRDDLEKFIRSKK